MEGDDNVGEAKAVTAGELVIILGQYHSAMSRLGSGIISLSGALKHSENAEVKEAADEAWLKLNEFIDYMDSVADDLNALAKEKGIPNGE
ncbi:hypothetical protein HX786_13870 [Pseudomonas sp. 21615526]|nr:MULTISPECIES: hypothetical protein [unclassified Pseudomonas]AUO21421.1 hypothetical protein C0058_05270 [Pseudomonas sp. NC02]MBT1267558.1 hypothetical protein [Pseudomonas sp. VS38]NVZ39170.1 hypothetical protein [Pseudomonas sp. 21615526]NWB54238.1 hypothetical protein [Pseudomonas sp. F8002]NWD01060.1 hypothetical protein [Pseudomonas sp. P7779]